MKRAVVRLPSEIVHRLDQLAARLRAAHPGRSCSRAAVVRALIAGDLAAAEEGGEKLDEVARRAIRPRPARRRSGSPSAGATRAAAPNGARSASAPPGRRPIGEK